MQTLLQKFPNADVRVFAVWEPILLTDWSAPNTLVLKRLTDARVRQYWDRRHLLAHWMAKDARPPQPAQNCCERNGALWDLVAVYPKHSRWTDTLSPATVFDGPVVDVIGDVEAALVGGTR
jgi:hypothetical protein